MEEDMRRIIHTEFVDWLKKHYGWTFSYYFHICGQMRRREIWDEFIRERETKK